MAVTTTLNLGALVLPRLVRGAGLSYGGFATVAGVFTLLYVLSDALVLAAEVAAVRHGRLWPRAFGACRPTSADRRALVLLIREQDRRRPTRREQDLGNPSDGDDRHGQSGRRLGGGRSGAAPIVHHGRMRMLRAARLPMVERLLSTVLAGGIGAAMILLKTLLH